MKSALSMGGELFLNKPPCVMFEKRTILDPEGNTVDGLYSAWISLNNPKQYNSYTTGIAKGVIRYSKRKK